MQRREQKSFATSLRLRMISKEEPEEGLILPTREIMTVPVDIFHVHSCLSPQQWPQNRDADAHRGVGRPWQRGMVEWGKSVQSRRRISSLPTYLGFVGGIYPPRTCYPYSAGHGTRQPDTVAKSMQTHRSIHHVPSHD